MLGDLVYYSSVPLGFRSINIVHLEMVNILLAVKVFAQAWYTRNVLVKCDNMAVVTVLRSGRARDPSLGRVATIFGILVH